MANNSENLLLLINLLKANFPAQYEQLSSDGTEIVVNLTIIMDELLQPSSVTCLTDIYSILLSLEIHSNISMVITNIDTTSEFPNIILHREEFWRYTLDRIKTFMEQFECLNPLIAIRAIPPFGTLNSTYGYDSLTKDEEYVYKLINQLEIVSGLWIIVTQSKSMDSLRFSLISTLHEKILTLCNQITARVTNRTNIHLLAVISSVCVMQSHFMPDDLSNELLKLSHISVKRLEESWGRISYNIIPGLPHCLTEFTSTNFISVESSHLSCRIRSWTLLFRQFLSDLSGYELTHVVLRCLLNDVSDWNLFYSHIFKSFPNEPNLQFCIDISSLIVFAVSVVQHFRSYSLPESHPMSDCLARLVTHTTNRYDDSDIKNNIHDILTSFKRYLADYQYPKVNSRDVCAETIQISLFSTNLKWKAINEKFDILRDYHKFGSNAAESNPIIVGEETLTMQRIMTIVQSVKISALTG